MNQLDCIWQDRELRREGKRSGPDWLWYASLLGMLALSLYLCLKEMSIHTSDMYLHALLGTEFVLTDLHSITCRIAYPLYHLMVSVLFKLGMPLNWAGALPAVLFKLITMALVHRYLVVTFKGEVSRAVITLTTVLLMVVTGLRIETLSYRVYWGWSEDRSVINFIGSPNLWQNPTQLVALAFALLTVFCTTHCWYEFQRKLPEQGDRTLIGWGKVAMLAVLLVACLSAKPTHMQALIPAAAVFFLVQWIRHPRNSRYFLQIIVAYLPAVAYFLIQYLYYTGVVVPYTSGVDFGATWRTAGEALRDALLMSAFPLFAVLCCYRKGFFRDKALVLTLLMLAFSVLESMFFRETGERLGHGNFKWASMSSSFLLWVVMLPKFVACLLEYRALLKGRPRPTCVAGWTDAPAVELSGAQTPGVRRALRLRAAGYLAALGLLLWHLYSTGYYLWFLLSTENSF